jgi:hypothetical protein
MSAADNTFLNQHQALVAQGANVVVALQQATDEAGVRALRVQVARFKGTLLVHQRMENEALYPRLMSHPDPAIAGPARALYADLGNIYDEFIALEQRFGDGGQILAALPEYGVALRRMLKRLFLRMQREDTELYALAERAHVSCLSEPPPNLGELDVREERERWARALIRPVDEP